MATTTTDAGRTRARSGTNQSPPENAQVAGKTTTTARNLYFGGEKEATGDVCRCTADVQKSPVKSSTAAMAVVAGGFVTSREKQVVAGNRRAVAGKLEHRVEVISGA